MLFSVRLRQRYMAHILLMVLPIERDLGYRFRTRTINPNLNPNPKTDPDPNPNGIVEFNVPLVKVTIIYAVQNDTQIKFKIVL